MAITVQHIKNIETVTSVPSDGKLLLTPDNGQYARATVSNIVGSAMDTTNDFDIDSTTNKVQLKDRRFRGTTAEWNALTAAQKAEYTYVDLIDDGSSGSSITIDPAPTENSENAVSSGGVYSSLAEKTNLTVISSSSKKETSSIATKAHTAGDYFELNGVFVKALTNIAIGDTLTENTNYESTNVGGEFKRINILLNNKASANDVTTLTNKLTVVDPDEGSGLITFGVDADGNYGYKKVGADTVTPFKSGGGGDYDFILNFSQLVIRSWSSYNNYLKATDILQNTELLFPANISAKKDNYILFFFASNTTAPNIRLHYADGYYVAEKIGYISLGGVLFAVQKIKFTEDKECTNIGIINTSNSFKLYSELDGNMFYVNYILLT